METVNRKRLFIASCLALLVTSLTFAIRAEIEGVFNTEYGLTMEQVGYAFSPAFWGFAIAMFLGGFIIDIVKTKTIIWMAFGLQLIGIIVLLFSKDQSSLYIANVFVGLGNGCVEAACNPLVTSLYPNNKTKMLNRFHVWFPGGIVIGGVLAVLFSKLGIPWEILVAMLFIPLGIYGFLFFGQKIPETERVSSGVSYKEMLKNIGAPFTIVAMVFLMIVAASTPAINLDFETATPYIILGAIVLLVFVEGKVINKGSLLFPLILFCMLLSASTELGTNQWTNALLKNNGVESPMLILVLVTGIMAVGRFFAGGLVHRLNPIGVLLGSAILSIGGLLLLSVSQGAVVTMASAVVFAIGVCYFWPTMIGVVSEYVPKSGALGMSILGGAGFVAVSVVIPIMGKSIDSVGPQATLQSMAILPVILTAAFVVLLLMVRNKK